MLKVQRSPARVSWLVMYGSTSISAKPTKVEAIELGESLAKKYGLTLQVN